MGERGGRFHVLDRVRVQGDPELEGKVGVITQVRRYGNGEFRYGVALEEGRIMDERNLSPTGEREPLETYLPPGRLFPQDEVEFQKEGRAVRGVVADWWEDEGVIKYDITVPGWQELEILQEHEVARIGPSGTRRSGPARSTKVSEAGG